MHVGCTTCKAQIKHHERFEPKKVEKLDRYNGLTDMSFHMLIKELLPRPSTNPKEKMISGCEVTFPETLFFENCAPSMLV